MEEFIVKGALGLSAAQSIYQLLAHATKVRLIVAPHITFLASGIVSGLLILLYNLAPAVAAAVVVWLALWSLVLMNKSSAKDNERKAPDQTTNQGAPQ